MHERQGSDFLGKQELTNWPTSGDSTPKLVSVDAVHGADLNILDGNLVKRRGLPNANNPSTTA